MDKEEGSLLRFRDALTTENSILHLINRFQYLKLLFNERPQLLIPLALLQQGAGKCFPADPLDLPQRFCYIRKIVHGSDANDRVKTLVRKRKLLRSSDITSMSFFLAFVDHAFAGINAFDRARKKRKIQSRTAANVEDFLFRFRM